MVYERKNGVLNNDIILNCVIMIITDIMHTYMYIFLMLQKDLLSFANINRQFLQYISSANDIRERKKSLCTVSEKLAIQSGTPKWFVVGIVVA